MRWVDLPGPHDPTRYILDSLLGFSTRVLPDGVLLTSTRAGGRKSLKTASIPLTRPPKAPRWQDTGVEEFLKAWNLCSHYWEIIYFLFQRGGQAWVFGGSQSIRRSQMRCFRGKGRPQTHREDYISQLEVAGEREDWASLPP